MKDPSGSGSFRVKHVVVLATAMLTFIPFWKAGAIVLCDFGSSAFYAGGIAMQAFGPAFPWFVLAVMIFSGAMLALYTESCSMFVRGGVYVVVKRAMGGFMAKISVSALMFDFLLTGPISGVCAGLYISGLLNELFQMAGIQMVIPSRAFAMLFAIGVTCYFWRQNTRGIEESGDKSVKIMGLATVVGAILLSWGVYTLFVRGVKMPPMTLSFTKHSLGWAADINWLKTIGLIGIIMAFGHSVLALSGLETMSMVYREIEAPKMRNLKKTAVMVFIFSIMFTGVLTFMSALIVPIDLIRTEYIDNLLAGLAMNMEGPNWARLVLQCLVVLTGGLVLSGAVNTSMVGANGVLNRVAEDGVLTSWFRGLHRRYGTTHRIITLVAGLQALIIVLCRGNVYLLGEAYAFGVLWSFVFQTLSVIMLRFKERGPREWMVPFNKKIRSPSGDIYIPVGIFFILGILLATSCANLVTKKIATIFGMTVTAIFFTIFYVSEKLNEKRAETAGDKEEKLNSRQEFDLTAALSGMNKPNKVLVAVKNPSNTVHLDSVLKTADDETTDILIVHSRHARGVQFGGEMSTMGPEEQHLFSKVVSRAEKFGQKVIPLLVFTNDPYYAIAHTARSAGVGQIILGVSGRVGAEVQLERLVMAWGALKGGPDPGKPVMARVVWEGRELSFQLS